MTTTAINRETGSLLNVSGECAKQETMDLGIGTVLVVDDELTYGSAWKHHTFFGFTVPLPFGRIFVNEEHPHDEIKVGKIIYDIDFIQASGGREQKGNSRG